ncbi:acidic leucine-rich nuclear phosphoprotein 32 family member B-like [Gossypium australe]|uniref:Acidic leucine-rich nuclear phosphoprotein 32 family member B-like n=1 Tax=Gossypium australe TaxID=47621 RepID=A0A5B6WQ87_9ROSI|nr:acidic leucine-rich nuclear phosphoprotein 32 family member B-like [Gossypium australe]
MQSKRMRVKQVQFECTNTTKTLTKLEDQMSQLMSMMEDIKRPIRTGIPSNTENNPWTERKEHMKTIALRSSKVLSSPNNPTQKENKEDTDYFREEDPQKADDEPEPEKVAEPVAELEDEPIKEVALIKVPFPSRSEEKRKRDEVELEN